MTQSNCSLVVIIHLWSETLSAVLGCGLLDVFRRQPPDQMQPPAPEEDRGQQEAERVIIKMMRIVMMTCYLRLSVIPRMPHPQETLSTWSLGLTSSSSVPVSSYWAWKHWHEAGSHLIIIIIIIIVIIIIIRPADHVLCPDWGYPPALSSVDQNTQADVTRVHTVLWRELLWNILYDCQKKIKVTLNI